MERDWNDEDGASSVGDFGLFNGGAAADGAGWSADCL